MFILFYSILLSISKMNSNDTQLMTKLYEKLIFLISKGHVSEELF
jgi:hypothetical protein